MRKNARMAILAALLAAWIGPVRAADIKAQAQDARRKAAAFLVSQANPDGTFGKSQARLVPGIVGLALYALAHSDQERPPAMTAAINNTAAYLVKCQQPNGAIAVPDFGNENYNTSVAAMALKSLNDPKYAQVLEKAKAFILNCQLAEDKGYNKDEHYQAYGGFGYGKSMRPDLSNTAFALEALKDLGVPQDSPAFKNALVFVRRCQDNTENDVPVMKDGDNTGAFLYLPGNTEACSEFGMVKSRSGKEVPKPYGNMTYQGIKSLIYCGLSPDSPELSKAWQWIRANYSVKEHPGGRGNEGYYYYLVAFAKAFAAAGIKELTVAEDRKVVWAEDLVSQLAALQKPDGSFANETPRWMESDPVLTTSYSLIALNLAADALGRTSGK
jgi:squalene-hopene/tetraprenyl-beta-curcumene cyclase